MFFELRAVYFYTWELSLGDLLHTVKHYIPGFTRFIGKPLHNLQYVSTLLFERALEGFSNLQFNISNIVVKLICYIQVFLIVFFVGLQP